jgi:transposase
MRGGPEVSKRLFSYVDTEDRIAGDHPLRAIRALVEQVLEGLSREFAKLYSHTGRPSIPPEHLLKASLLQAFFTIRSERQLMEPINYNILFRWLVGLSMDDQVWDASTFCKNRERLMQADVAKSFMVKLLSLPDVKGPLSSEHFSVDGTLINARASMKSFVPKDGSGEPPAPGRNGTRNFRSEKRSNDTHASTTDPDAQLFRKGNGQSSRLSFMGHTLMENRNGLVVDCELTRATGTAEREAALTMIKRSRQGGRKAAKRMARKTRVTLGADKGYDAQDFVLTLKDQQVTPHIAINGTVSKTGKLRKTVVDGRTRRHKGYEISQRIRKRIEESFGWAKTIGGAAKLKLRGIAKASAFFTFQMIAYNLIRIPKLLTQAA